LIAARDALDADGQAVFDRIVESRGALPRPFEVLLHAPSMAGPVAELGHVVKFGSHLSDADRELVTLATGRAHGCAFVWESHLGSARAAGISGSTIEALERGGDALGSREAALVALVNELRDTSAVSDQTYRAGHELVGTQGMVELVLTVGYYTMLAYAMRAFDAC
jgi:AhpD family alkylhydroperoxidase